MTVMLTGFQREVNWIFLFHQSHAITKLIANMLCQDRSRHGVNNTKKSDIQFTSST